MSTPEQRTALLGAQIDLGVAHRFPTNRGRSDGITATRVFDDPLEAALVAADHALARQGEIAPTDLTDMPFLFMDRSFDAGFYDRVLTALTAAGLRPRIEATYDDRATVWALVAQVKGWTVAFHSQLANPPTGTVAVRIAGFRVPFGLELLARRSESSPHVRAVASLIRRLRVGGEERRQ
jgi:DNA-binding transcriptional LysR family regulator